VTVTGPDGPPSTARGDGIDTGVGIQLMLLSFAAGCMDILSYRQLGQVFTSAMTGNAALLGLDIGQGNLSATSRNLAAFAGFIGGLVVGATLLRGQKSGWSRAVTWTLVLEEVLLVGFAALWQIGEGPSSGQLLYGLIALSGIAMGMQSAVAHRVGVPGITTTYFTGTLTGIVMGSIGRTPRPKGARGPRRLQWPMLAFLAYVAAAALTGLLETSPPPRLPSAGFFVVPALPAAALAVVLLVAIASVVISARRRRRVIS
jgi:uncharacterized membrane protein YoaK (UPF0700 family)